MKKLIFIGLVFSLVAVSFGLYFKNAGNSNKTPQSAFSDEAKTEFARLSKFYAGTKSFEAKYKISLLDLDGKLLESGTGYLVQDTNRLFSQLLGFEQLIANGLAIAVSHDEETFSAYRISPEETQGILSNQWQSIVWADSSHLLPDSILELQKVNDKLFRIVIHAETGTYYRTEIDYNPQNLQLQNIRLFTLKENQNEDYLPRNGNNESDLPNNLIVQYHYETLILNPKIDDKQFDAGRFISISNGKIVPKPKYRDYQVISTSENENERND